MTKEKLIDELLDLACRCNDDYLEISLALTNISSALQASMIGELVDALVPLAQKINERVLFVARNRASLGSKI